MNECVCYKQDYEVKCPRNRRLTELRISKGEYHAHCAYYSHEKLAEEQARLAR